MDKKYLKKRIIFIVALLVVILLVCYFYQRSQIIVSKSIPEVFDKSKIEVRFENGGTYLLYNNKFVTPIIHDDSGTLYILNGIGQDLVLYNFSKSYDIDKNSNEIIICKNILNFDKKDKPYYQIIKIPKNKYSDLVQQNTITIRIKYIGLSDYELIQYNFLTKTFTTIEKVSQGK